MDSIEMEKSKAFITVEIIECIPDAIVQKTTLKRSTGNITMMSLDVKEGYFYNFFVNGHPASEGFSVRGIKSGDLRRRDCEGDALTDHCYPVVPFRQGNQITGCMV